VLARIVPPACRSWVPCFRIRSNKEIGRLFEAIYSAFLFCAPPELRQSPEAHLRITYNSWFTCNANRDKEKSRERLGDRGLQLSSHKERLTRDSCHTLYSAAGHLLGGAQAIEFEPKMPLGDEKADLVP
jgi:hypothetical protein